MFGSDHTDCIPSPWKGEEGNGATDLHAVGHEPPRGGGE